MGLLTDLLGDGNATYEAWQTATLINSYTGTAYYRRAKDGKTVQLLVSVDNGTSGNPAFNLPAGYRPATNQSLPGADDDTAAFVYWLALTSGNVTPHSGVATDTRTLSATIVIDLT